MLGTNATEELPGLSRPLGPWRSAPALGLSSAIEISVLGPLVLRVDGVRMVPTAGKQRQVLALLAVRRNHVVSTEVLMRELWNDEPPRSALTALQTYIGQIRQALAELLGVDRKVVASRCLVTEADGYSLWINPAGLDLDSFESHNARARAAVAVGDLDTARRSLKAALRCWRGKPLDNVRKGPVLADWAEGVTTLRLSALERWIEVNIAAGLHQDMHAEIALLCSEYPSHEGFRALLMIALHRCGRSVEALEAFHRFRARVVEEFGVEPSPRLTRLYHSILVGESIDEPIRPVAAVVN